MENCTLKALAGLAREKHAKN